MLAKFQEKIRIPALLFVTFLMLPISVFSGLALAPLLVILATPVLTITPPRNHLLYSLFFLFIIYVFASAIWSINVEHTLASWGKLVALFVLGFSCLYYQNYILPEQVSRLQKITLLSLILTLILLIIEWQSNGFLTLQFRSLIGAGRQPFEPHMLNRGACVVALIFWASTLKLHSRVMLTLWVVTLRLLGMLDSLSALLGFIVASIAYSWMRYTTYHYTLVGCFISTLLLVPLAAALIEPDAITQQLPQLPASAIHRLYIWNFVLEKIFNNIILGYGFDVSRYINGATEFVVTNGIVMEEWHQLPLHPHNNILQVWLELGLVGYAMFIGFVTVLLLSIIQSRLLTSTERAAMMASTTSYITIGMTGFSAWQHWWIATGFLAASLLLLLSQKEE